MGIEYAPDARQTFQLTGPEIRVIDFHGLGPTLSARAQATQVLVSRDNDGSVGVVALGVRNSIGTAIALHLNMQAEQLRHIGAQMIAAANELDSRAGVS